LKQRKAAANVISRYLCGIIINSAWR